MVFFQDTRTTIRIHGSRKKGVVVQSDVVASNGMIHIINKLMDSVSPTVESDTQVKLQRPEPHLSVLPAWFSHFMNILSISSQENMMKIISDYGKFDKFKSLLEVCRLM